MGSIASPYRQYPPQCENVASLKSVEDALKRIFPSKQTQTRVQLARSTMGADVCDVTDGQLEIYLTEFQSMIDACLDEFERSAFDGLTLRQLVRED